MTIKEFMKDLDNSKAVPGKQGMPSFKEAMLESVSIWSNNSCLGYALTAAQAAGFTEEQIRDLMQEIKFAFDDLSVEEAEKIFCNSPY